MVEAAQDAPGAVGEDALDALAAGRDGATVHAILGRGKRPIILPAVDATTLRTSATR